MKRDVDKYYKLICKDYMEMVETLHELEELAQKKMIPPEQLDQMKQQVENMKINWQRIGYIMFLFNKPAKKSKELKYTKQNKHLLSKEGMYEAIHEENLEGIQKIKHAFD